MDPEANVNEQRVLGAKLVEPVDVDELKAECSYHEDGGHDAEGNDLGSVDALIDYKNALEDRVRTLSIDAARLAELALSLDDWRVRGGFDPYLPPENGHLPSHAQMLSLGRLMRAQGAKGARIGLGTMGLNEKWIGVSLLYWGDGDHGGITEAGIDPVGDVST